MAAKSAKLRLNSLRSRISGAETQLRSFGMPIPVKRIQTITNRSGSEYGSGCKSTPLTTLKIAVFAPMPSASVRIATAVKPGFFASILIPYRKSCSNVVILSLVTSGCEQGKRLKCKG